MSEESERYQAGPQQGVPDDVRVELANYAHSAWAGWMQYLFSKSQFHADGSVTIPSESVKRWQRQMLTPYGDLPATEQASDLAEADRMLAIMEQANER